MTVDDLGQLARLVSGGQTGPDRAALDVAIRAGVEYGGWCPRGGWAEDCPEPPGLLTAYPLLHETPTSDGSLRTVWNVRDSHATLVLRPSAAAPSAGTDLTVFTAEQLGRPCLVVDTDDLTAILGWLAPLGRGLTLNVAGPRESQAPGLYRSSVVLLERLVRVTTPDRHGQR